MDELPKHITTIKRTLVGGIIFALVSFLWIYKALDDNTVIHISVLAIYFKYIAIVVLVISWCMMLLNPFLIAVSKDAVDFRSFLRRELINFSDVKEIKIWPKTSWRLFYQPSLELRHSKGVYTVHFGYWDYDQYRIPLRNAFLAAQKLHPNIRMT